MTDDFLDSYAPIEGEVVTDEPWKLPAPADYADAFDAPEPPTLWERFCRWAKGVQHD